MADYFGTTTPGSSTDANSGATWFGNVDETFTCPNSGDQTLVELSAYTKSNGGTPGVIRLAIYSEDYSELIAEGSSEVEVSSTSADWYGHLSAASITPNPATLTGGTNYRIVLAINGGDVRTHYDGGFSGDIKFGGTTDYTGGFPSSLSAPGSAYVAINMRAGVEAVGGGGFVAYPRPRGEHGGASILGGGIN